MGKFFLLAVVSLVVAISVLWWSPRYLTYAELPVKANAVILLVGPGNEARVAEARQLLEEGYAHHLLIPAYNRLCAGSREAGAFFDVPAPRKQSHIVNGNWDFYPIRFEETHIELLEAKRFMDIAGYRSALIVSSPYHMRRVSMIAQQVFPKQRYSIRCVPARTEVSDLGFWRLGPADLRWQVSEYLKICWYQLYRYWPYPQGSYGHSP